MAEYGEVLIQNFPTNEKLRLIVDKENPKAVNLKEKYESILPDSDFLVGKKLAELELKILESGYGKQETEEKKTLEEILINFPVESARYFREGKKLKYSPDGYNLLTYLSQYRNGVGIELVRLSLLNNKQKEARSLFYQEQLEHINTDILPEANYAKTQYVRRMIRCYEVEMGLNETPYEEKHFLKHLISAFEHQIKSWSRQVESGHRPEENSSSQESRRFAQGPDGRRFTMKSRPN